MELKKTHTGLWVTLTVLLALALALLCFLAAGPKSLTPDFFRYGLYPLSSVPALSSGLEARFGGDAILTDRNAPVGAGSVVYRHNGRDEVVRYQIFRVGRVIEFLSANALWVWGLSGAAAALCAVLWATAPRRRVKRLQAQMKKTFAACGARFEQEDEGVEY